MPREKVATFLLATSRQADALERGGDPLVARRSAASPISRAV